MNFWKLIRPAQYLHRGLYALGLGPLIGQIVLLLTTTGRKSGKYRVTPLQYEEIDGIYYLGASRGLMMRRAHGLPSRPSRSQLETLAKTLVVVAIRPRL